MTGLHQHDHWLDNLASTSLHQSPCFSFLPACVFSVVSSHYVSFSSRGHQLLPPARSFPKLFAQISSLSGWGKRRVGCGMLLAAVNGCACMCLCVGVCPVCVDERLPCQSASDYACCVLSEGKCTLPQSSGEPRGFFFFLLHSRCIYACICHSQKQDDQMRL